MKPSEQLAARLNVQLNQATAKALNSQTQVVHFPGGHTVLWEGESAAYCYYMIQGVVRGYYIDKNGNDITKCFCVEDEFFLPKGFELVLLQPLP